MASSSAPASSTCPVCVPVLTPPVMGYNVEASIRQINPGLLNRPLVTVLHTAIVKLTRTMT